MERVGLIVISIVVASTLLVGASLGAEWLQPYFDSGFPYGQDQWISVAGTSWATMALSMTVEPRHSTSAKETQVASR